MKNRLLSLALAVLMVVGMLPTTVWAADAKATGTVVATVGDEEYTSVADAVSKSNGGVVYVVADAEVGTAMSTACTLVVNEGVTLTLFDKGSIGGDVKLINNGTIVMEVSGGANNSQTNLADKLSATYVNEFVLTTDDGSYFTVAATQVKSGVTVTVADGAILNVTGTVSVAGTFVAEAGTNVVMGDKGEIVVAEDSKGVVDLSAAVVSTTVADEEELIEALASEIGYNGITVDDLTVTQNIEITNGVTLTLTGDATIAADASLTTNGGTIVVADEATLTQKVKTEEQFVAALSDKNVTDVAVDGDAITITKNVTIPADKMISAVGTAGTANYAKIKPAAGVTITKEVDDKVALEAALLTTNAATLYVRVVGNIDDVTNVTVPNFKTLEIASGVVVTVTTGNTLTVKGTLVNNGKIVGTVSNVGTEEGAGVNEVELAAGSLTNDALVGVTSVIVTEGTLSADVTVPAGVTMTLKGDVTVPANYDLTVNGTLNKGDNEITKQVDGATTTTTLVDALANTAYDVVEVTGSFEQTKSVTVPAGVTLKIADGVNLTFGVAADLTVKGEVEFADYNVSDSYIAKNVGKAADVSTALNHENYNKVVLLSDATLSNLTVPAKKTMDFNSKNVVISGTYVVEGEVAGATNVKVTASKYTVYVDAAGEIATAFDTNGATNVVVTKNITESSLSVGEGKTLTINEGVTLTVEAAPTITGKVDGKGELALSLSSGTVSDATFTADIDRVIVKTGATLDTTVNVESGKTLEIANDCSSTTTINVKDGGALVVNGCEVTNATVKVAKTGTVTVKDDGSIAATPVAEKTGDTFAYIWELTADSAAEDLTVTSNAVADYTKIVLNGWVDGETLKATTFTVKETSSAAALTVNKGQEFVVGEKVTLIVDGTLTNNGTITNNGTVTVVVADEDELNAALKNSDVDVVEVGTAITATTGYVTIPADKTVKLTQALTISAGHVLTNNGTITATAYANLDVNGTLVNNGTAILTGDVSVLTAAMDDTSKTNDKMVFDHLVYSGSNNLTADATLYAGQTLTIPADETFEIDDTYTLTVPVGAEIVLEKKSDENGAAADAVLTVTGDLEVQVDTASDLTAALATTSKATIVTVTGDITNATDVVVPTTKTLKVAEDASLEADTLTLEGSATATVAGSLTVYEALNIAQNALSVERNATLLVGEGIDTSKVNASYGATIGTVDTWVNPFTDVEEGRFYYEAVEWAVKNGVTAGTTATTFSPDQDCTRGQIVTFLWRAAGEPSVEGVENPFTDLDENASYYEAVLWAVSEGITSGRTATTFAPNETCTRAEIVTFLWNYMGKPEATSTEHSFTDVEEGRFYYNAMLWAVETGVTAGKTETTFEPGTTCNRGEAVTFLFRAENLK